MTENIKSLTDYELDLNSIDELVESALKEDIASGDITTNNIIPEDKKVKAIIKAKEDGIIAGLAIAEKVFSYFDSKITWKQNFNDGDNIKNRVNVAEVEGSHRAILTGERTALNFMQRMSGIATQVSKYVDAVSNTETKILDTRKTLPGLRMLDKYSVRMGGGVNHRIGLFDMVMIKDNHIKVAGSITDAVKSIRKEYDRKFKIEVETSNLDELKEALETGADIIMFDNMSNESMREAVNIVNGKALTEASGNMTIDRVKEVAECGVDFISVGALTHSVKALDIGLYIID